LIEFRNLTYKTLSGEVLIRNSDLKIEKGEKVLLCGKTGSGKTTILKIINGLIPKIYKGKLTGYVKTVPPKDSYMILQHPTEQILFEKTIDEILFSLSSSSFNPKAIKDKIVEFAEELNILNLLNKRTGELSEGEKQLILITMALASDAEYIILDEPFAHLHQSNVRKVIKLLFNSDKTIIIADHRPYKASYDRIFLIKNKKIVEDKIKLIKFTSFNCIDCKVNYDSLEQMVCDAVFNQEKTVLAVTGNNGVGKTTALRTLAKLISKKTRCKNIKISYCAQYPYYHFSKSKVYKEVDEIWLNLFEIEKLRNRHPFSLSGGEARRVAIAKCMNSDILFLDEPTAGQDYEFKLKLASLLRNHGKTAFVSTHDPLFAKLCDKVVKLEN